MSSFVHQMVEYAVAHSACTGLIVFASVAVEAAPVVGAFYPGTSIVMGLVALVAAHGNPVWLLVLLAALGGVAGDAAAYWIGCRYSASLTTTWPLARRTQLLEKGEQFFRRHGAWSVVLARFLPGVRAIVPLVAGMLHMDRTRFSLANVGSAIVWAVSHVGMAAGVGAALASRTTDMVAYGQAAVILVGIFACAWLLHWVFQHVRGPEKSGPLERRP